MSLLGHRRLTGKQTFYAVDHDFSGEFLRIFDDIKKKKKTVKSNKKYHVYIEHWLK